MAQKELWNRSAPAWITFSEGDSNRNLLLDPIMLEVAGDVRGKSVCDVGCGEGRFSRALVERGALVTAIDPCLPLLENACNQEPKASYLLGSGEALPVQSGQFDLVICYLVLIDIADFRAAIREMARIAKPGGRILIANLNSFCTTSSSAWLRNEGGDMLHVAVDNYFGERGEIVAWRGIEIINYHRPFEAYMQAFLGAGLQLLAFREPAPTSEMAAQSGKMAEASRVPFFHVMEWRKE